MSTQSGQENGKLNGKFNRWRTVSKMNPFTIPLRCLQRNPLAASAGAFWPGVCGVHHLGFPRGFIGLSSQ
jgi:hypothetical protein